MGPLRQKAGLAIERSRCQKNSKNKKGNDKGTRTPSWAHPARLWAWDSFAEMRGNYKKDLIVYGWAVVTLVPAIALFPCQDDSTT